MHVIYEPKGAAREYAELAVNLYDGCSHGCAYCYAPRVLRADPAKWSSTAPQPRKPNMLELLRKDIDLLKKKYPDGDRPEILLCFTCDPYHGGDTQLTRDALIAIGEAGFRARILTKGGLRAERDFDVMHEYGHVFGVSIYGRYDLEPWAARASERVDTLRMAAQDGMKTWVSCEPVLDLQEVAYITGALEFVDEWHFGALSGGRDGIDWAVGAPRLNASLDELGIRYKFKQSLRKYVEDEK